MSFRDRGLLARFLYLLPDSLIGYRELDAYRPGASVPSGVEAAYQAGIGAMLDWPPAVNDPSGKSTHLVELTPEAYAELLAFNQGLEVGMRPGNPYANITDLVSKMQGTTARLAAILHGITHAYDRPWEIHIARDTMHQAIAMAKVFLEHGLAAMALMATDHPSGPVTQVWNWIKRGHYPKLTEREVYQALKGSFPKVADLREVLIALEQRGYIRLVPPPHAGPGRPSSPMIEVRPGLKAAGC